MSGEEYKCYYLNCQKSYKTKYNLRRHINCTHLRIKNFTCCYCSKSFGTKQNLQEHEKLHVKEDFSLNKKTVKPKTAKVNPSNPRPFVLSKHYMEPKAEYEFPAAPGPLPVLPPVDEERQGNWGKIKIPVIPILLDGIL